MALIISNSHRSETQRKEAFKISGLFALSIFGINSYHGIKLNYLMYKHSDNLGNKHKLAKFMCGSLSLTGVSLLKGIIYGMGVPFSLVYTLCSIGFGKRGFRHLRPLSQYSNTIIGNYSKYYPL